MKFKQSMTFRKGTDGWWFLNLKINNEIQSIFGVFFFKLLNLLEATYVFVVLPCMIPHKVARWPNNNSVVFRIIPLLKLWLGAIFNCAIYENDDVEFFWLILRNKIK